MIFSKFIGKMKMLRLKLREGGKVGLQMKFDCDS